jgi:hypothetical protein
MVESCCNYIPLVSNPYAETGRCNNCNEEYKIDPKEEEKLMGMKGKLLQLVILMLGKEA